MVDATDSTRGGDELAPRHILEAMTVPDLPVDFADRVMVALAPGVTAPQRSSRLPWAIAAATTAFAVAAMLVLVWALPARTPAASEPTPVVVAAPPPSPAQAPMPSVGHLVLEVEPTDATVRVDGVTVTGPSPFVVTNLAVGRHAIEVEHAGRQRWSRTVDVPSGPLTLPIRLQATPQSPAVIVETFLPKPPRPAKPRRKRAGRAEDVPDLVDPFTARKPTSPPPPFGGD